MAVMKVVRRWKSRFCCSRVRAHWELVVGRDVRLGVSKFGCLMRRWRAALSQRRPEVVNKLQATILVRFYLTHRVLVPVSVTFSKRGTSGMTVGMGATDVVGVGGKGKTAVVVGLKASITPCGSIISAVGCLNMRFVCVERSFVEFLKPSEVH